MNALARLAVPARFVRAPEELYPGSSPFDKIIFPGDGHFAATMDMLARSGYGEAIRGWLAAGRPFLGICIGMQILFECSEEAPGTAGLGIIKGEVKKFPGAKIPQIGWNWTRPKHGSRLFNPASDGAYFYYIHSYYCAPDDERCSAAETNYYVPYCSALEQGSLAACQFHPEKSGETGLALLEHWSRQPVSLSIVANTGNGFVSGKPETKPETGNITKRIIPCLDVDDGRVVKGVKFKGIVDAGDPVELARRYNADRADELTFLDIGASHKSRAMLLDIVRQVAAEVFIPLCVGGGIRTVEDMRLAMNAGADKVSVCTSALERPELLAEMAAAYGRQCVVLSMDAKRVNTKGESSRWHAFAKGGRVDTGRDALEWAREAVRLGAGEILLNSIDADGTGAGYDLELTHAIMKAVPVPVIASGGAGSLTQISAAAAVADAALVASILHFGKTTITAIKAHLAADGIPVRV
jgi:cyclase